MTTSYGDVVSHRAASTRDGRRGRPSEPQGSQPPATAGRPLVALGRNRLRVDQCDDQPQIPPVRLKRVHRRLPRSPSRQELVHQLQHHNIPSVLHKSYYAAFRPFGEVLAARTNQLSRSRRHARTTAALDPNHATRSRQRTRQSRVAKSMWPSHAARPTHTQRQRPSSTCATHRARRPDNASRAQRCPRSVRRALSVGRELSTNSPRPAFSCQNAAQNAAPGTRASSTEARPATAKPATRNLSRALPLSVDST